ncbi:MAG: hypothetical protein LAP61_26575 [Acidobacteriia bacterium]|nr:hypothetical protein [Terriglobia bacterium]
MTAIRVVPTMFCLALFGAAFSPSAKADDYDKKTTFTFSQPIEIPPVHLTGYRVLPAGTYVFKLINSSSNRHIVQIFNKDQTKIFATILAIPNYRLQPKDKSVITFSEAVQGNPQAIRAWFYPGANWGEEFVYPKAKAVELAKATNLPVLEMPAPAKEEVAKPEEARAELERAPVMAVRPSGEEVEIAQVVTPPPAAEVAQAIAAPAPARAAEPKLPTTASPLPLIALLGLLALGGALTLRVVEKRGL